MGRRDTDIVMTSSPFSVRERLLLDEMKRILGILTDANLVRAAMFFYARHLELDGLQVDDFGLRDPGRSRRTRRPGAHPRKSRAKAQPPLDEPDREPLYPAGAQGLSEQKTRRSA